MGYQERTKMNTKENVKKEYNELYKTRPTKWADTSRSVFMANAIKELMPVPKTIIDIGCGIGITLETMQSSFLEADLYGLDPSEEAIELAKTRVPNGTFYADFLDEFKSKKKYDIVLCLGVAEHVEDLPEFLKSLKTLVKKDGILYFEVPHNLIYSRGPKTYRRLRVGSRQVEWHLDLRDWEKKLLEADFEVIKRYRGKKPSWEFIWILK
jgi:2-polyprenyl-3-methyl-5-hydroxy-6-metoxy-1,4-benzoquinol methylase